MRHAEREAFVYDGRGNNRRNHVLFHFVWFTSQPVIMTGRIYSAPRINEVIITNSAGLSFSSCWSETPVPLPPALPPCLPASRSGSSLLSLLVFLSLAIFSSWLIAGKLLCTSFCLNLFNRRKVQLIWCQGGASANVFARIWLRSFKRGSSGKPNSTDTSDVWKLESLIIKPFASIDALIFKMYVLSFFFFFCLLAKSNVGRIVYKILPRIRRLQVGQSADEGIHNFQKFWGTAKWCRDGPRAT